jgi:hypothetical protein
MSFEPYIKPHGIGDLRFFFATEEARNWYDPLKPYTKLEYEWVWKNVHFVENGNVGDIVDAGCHHGNYAVLFAQQDGVRLHCVDCVKNFLDITEINLKLNEDVTEGYGTDLDGKIEYNLYHHRLAKGAGFFSITEYDRIDVYKMDIEGSEFELMPEEIDDFPTVHTWIVEIHPHAGDPNVIAQAFADRGFELLKVDRERMVVRPYELGERWQTHATLIARKV